MSYPSMPRNTYSPDSSSNIPLSNFALTPNLTAAIPSSYSMSPGMASTITPTVNSPNTPKATSTSTTTPFSGNNNFKNAIISSQQFDGCWEEKLIHELLGGKAGEAITSNPFYNPKIWITALAIAILEVKCSDTKSNWEIVTNKARTFMSKFVFTNEKMEKEKVIPHIECVISEAVQVIQRLKV